MAALALGQTAADRPGRWYPLEVDAELGRLRALGYVGGSEDPEGAAGVRVFDRERTQPGRNLYSSGHRAQAVLMELDGTVLKTWQADFAEVFPDRPELASHVAAATWRRVALLPDGGLLAIYEGLGMVRLDARSSVVWSRSNGAHHDLEVRPDGSILVLTREAHARREGLPILEDFVVELGPDGEERRRISVLQAMESSAFAELVRQPVDWETGDLLHTNSLQWLDGSIRTTHPAFQRGRVLVSSRTRGFLAVLDLASEQVVWATKGPWAKQHDAELVAPDRMLLFDNQGLGEGRSRVLVLEPGTDRIRWSWGGTPDQPLHSEVLGAVQQLANGNVLITESTHGRALEVAPDGSVVWEFRNPEVAEGRYVAAIYELIRLGTATRSK